MGWAGTGSPHRRAALCVMAALGWACGPGGQGEVADPAHASLPQAGPLTDSAFVALVDRLSEPGGFFDTDNLISNETGYLKVLGALPPGGTTGGAYLGVGPDQNFSYLARLRPELAFMVDIRRDNLLHHLLLKVLMERAPTRVEFLSALTGKAAPHDAPTWTGRSGAQVVAWVDEAPTDEGVREGLHARVREDVTALGLPLGDDDLATIRRFHKTFMDAGLDLRFTTLGRPPRPYYPTYRELILETDLDGRAASYLADADAYAFVRGLQASNRVIPVVGDLAGAHAVREVGRVLEEQGLALSAVYTSNVEFYLWGGGTFGAWVENVASLPAQEDAVVIRSYFPNFGGRHPSAVPGYYATQTLQPLASLTRGGFTSYWEAVTRDFLPLIGGEAGG